MRRKVQNGIFVSLTSAATAIAVIALLLILYSLVVNGFGGINFAVFTLDQPPPDMPGGLRNAILGSLEMCGIGMAIAVWWVFLQVLGWPNMAMATSSQTLSVF